MDDKHRVKVGEPCTPVAERGRPVFNVSTLQSFEVCDHNITRFSLIPTVLLQVDIPPAFYGSFMMDNSMLR